MHHIRFKSIPTDKVAIHPLFEMEHYDDDNGTQWFCPKRVKGSNRCRGRWHSNGHNRSQARTDHPNKRGGSGLPDRLKTAIVRGAGRRFVTNNPLFMFDYTYNGKTRGVLALARM